jgi:hypothetical protein
VGTAHEGDAGRVELAGGESATLRLQRVLASACEAFPSLFDDVAVEIGVAPGRFKQTYPEVLPRFEAARVDAAERAEVAVVLQRAAHSAVVWSTATGEVPLREHVDAPVAPFEVTSVRLPGDGRLHPRVPIDGIDRDGDELVAEVRSLVERGSASSSVADGIEWIVDRAGVEGVDLSDRRVVVLGAGAELAPTRLWLEGGAEVLWIDVTDPPTVLLASDRLAGTLHWVPGGSDLLASPRRIRATIERFAAGGPVDLGLYAYAAGQAREWRLVAAMNTIVDALPPEVVGSVAMLVSPTTCGTLTPEDLEGEERRRRERPHWQAALAGARLLGHGPGHAVHGATSTNRGIVSIQGGSYQAAQYLGKLIAAEVWATRERPLRVSANTAGISRTESIHHPVFDTAFSGAGSLGVETFAADTTAHLNGLLTLRDRLDPAMRSPGQLFSTRVHGGIYELPHPIEPALRVAAAIGVLGDPRRIVSLVRRS